MSVITTYSPLPGPRSFSVQAQLKEEIRVCSFKVLIGQIQWLEVSPSKLTCCVRLMVSHFADEQTSHVTPAIALLVTYV